MWSLLWKEMSAGTGIPPGNNKVTGNQKTENDGAGEHYLLEAAESFRCIENVASVSFNLYV